MKGLPRIISLLLMVFYVSLWIFNDDVRSRPTLAIVLQGLLTIVLLAAWRWEKIAGRLAAIGGLAFLLIVTVAAIAVYDIHPTAALLGGALLALPYALTGWLFFIAGREVEETQGSGANQRPVGSAENPG